MKKREFELKIGLNITEDNYEDLIEIYNKALKNKSKRFPFRMLKSHNEGDDDKIFTFDKINSNKNKTK